MRNSKGFTLVELLVAVAILGIITGMSIPLIRNIQVYNNEKKFKEYGSAMLSSAKLYRDSYDEDLFGRKRSGCALVTLSQLINRGLMKDYPDGKITCNYTDTMVRIVKINKKYGYSYQLLCGTDLAHPSYAFSTFSKREELLQSLNRDSTEDEDIFENQSFGGFDLSACNMKNSMTIQANPAMGVDKAESYSVKVAVSSSTGIGNGGVNIQYAWVEAPEDASVEETPVVDNSEEDDNPDGEVSDEIETVNVEDVEIDYASITNWKSLNFSKIESESSQQEKLVSSFVETITSTSKSISPPTTTTANKWYLVLKVNRFQDLTGEEYPNQYEIFGEYNIAKKYTLTYDDNGGSGCSSKKKESILGRGETDVWGELCIPTKEGSVFAEWNTKADGTGTTITEDTPVASDVRVYAKWTTAKVIIRYKLMSNETITATTTSADGSSTYKWRRGSGDFIERSINDENYKKLTTSIVSGKDKTLDLANYNSSHALYITSNAGYTRAKSGAEWICESGCKNPNQTFNQKNILISDTNDICDTSHGNCTISIRVNWDSSSIAAIPVYLNQQGGSGGTSATYSYKSKWYNTGNPAESTTNITSVIKPTKAGNTFGGYYSNKDGNGTQTIKANGTIRAAASDVTSSTTWFAKWTLNTCTINFLPNGGTFNNNTDKTTKTLQYGKSVSNFWNATGGTYDATRTGYTITSSKAWLLSGTTTTIDETKGYKATQICTSLGSKNQTVNLKVNWQAKKIAVTFNCNGGSGGGTNKFTYGNSEQKFSTTCTRTGYRLVGWKLKKSDTSAKYSVDSIVSNSWINTNSPKITLYAHWVGNVYKVTLNQNGGSGGTSTIYEKYNIGWYSNSAATSGISKITIPTKGWYTFEGYYTESSGGVKIINGDGTFVSGKTKQFTANGTLYAHWRKNRLTISYYTNGGELAAARDVACPESIGDSCKNVCTRLDTNLASCTGNKTGKVIVGIYSFDGEQFSDAGVRDHNYPVSEATLYMKRDGYSANDYWHVGSSNSSVKIHEDMIFPLVTDFAQWLQNNSNINYYDNLKKGDVTVDLYAGWNKN